MQEQLTRFSELTTWATRKTGELDIIRKTLKENEVVLANATKAVTLHAEECTVLKIMGELLRERIKKRLENLVTLALRSVFQNNDYRFELDMDLKRGQMIATPMLISRFKGEEIRQTVLNGHGGGPADIIMFVLQAVVLVLTHPKLNRIMLLDERFSHVRDEIGDVAVLLRKFHDITGIKFVIITKEKDLCEAADKIYDVTKISDGTTVFKERVE